MGDTQRKKKRIPLYLQILLGMLGGILAGTIALYFHGEEFVGMWLKPFGRVFIKLLQLIAVPLVFLSLFKGVTGLQDISRFSKIGLRTVAIYLGTTFFAILIGVTLALSIRPGRFFDREEAAGMQQNYQEVVEQQRAVAELTQERGPLAFLDEIIPDNIVNAASSNNRMLQVIFFALLFGIAALSLDREKTAPVIKLFDSLYEIVLKMVDFIILFTPYGVFALMTTLVVDFSGNMSVFGALAVYAGTVVLALLTLIFLFYPALVHFFSRLRPVFFLKNIYPVQLLAFTTSSSAAALPLTLEVTEQKLGVSNEVASFVLPIGTTINMDGTSCYQAIAVIFIAQVLGIELTWAQLLSVILLTTLSSIGTPAIPGGSYVILTMVLSSIGVPAEGLALILGVDRPLDMLRTAVNVTGDATVAAMIDKKST